MGTQSQAAISLGEPLSLIYPKGERNQLSAALELPTSLEAPLSKGQQVGKMYIKFNQEPVMTKSLFVDGDYPEGSLVDKLVSSIKRLLF